MIDQLFVFLLLLYIYVYVSVALCALGLAWLISYFVRLHARSKIGYTPDDGGETDGPPSLPW